MEKYRKKTGEDSTDWGVQGYEGADILLHGIAKAGSTDSDAIVKAIEGISQGSATRGC